MSAKDCGNHGKSRRKRLFRFLFSFFLAFIIAVLFVILLVWLILRPSKPRFTLQDATVYQFNVSQNNYLSSNLQVTIASKNPNDRIGVYYDKLDVYASYRGEQITIPNSLPPTYQGHNDLNVWSPYITGQNIPIAPYFGLMLAQDQTAGMILLNIKVNGRVRWKVGTWTSGKYHLFVNCPAYIQFGIGGKNSGSGIGSGYGNKFSLDRDCSTDV
ncbi:hypothetical protein IFM89_018868 [Coptis chinensis]|uniref:Late embryogenesis abundant protein LEA-2 subgroup domain-containing protein n=1 Tax=Coptis chinensis TaxID=261450 RepID=A0A835HFN7_9MAGN|nr:hypothetical protein IFM89_018868 [Coptis chinensis]